jgi:hypothetical protein
MKHFTKTFIVLVTLFIFLQPSEPLFSQENSIIQDIHYYDVNSEIARRQTQRLRTAQDDKVRADYGEEIVFSLDAGVCVQFADGSGRRLLIARNAEYHNPFVYPAWSLDGTHIAFAAQWATDPRKADLIVANADGTGATVILTLDAGYYTSVIQSISWHWANEYIMFSYLFDDASLNVVGCVCTIRYDGYDFTVGPGNDRNWSQYEPVYGSSRYAYVSIGSPFDMNTRLHSSNLNGTNDLVWLTYLDVISGFTHVAWDDPTHIYTIIRGWDAYPNCEELLRVDNSGNFTVIGISDAYASLWCPTPSPNRDSLYNAELTASASTLWLTVLGTNGLPVSVTSKGEGFFPNWRQTIPSGVKETSEPSSSSVATLEQNEPNPFVSSTRIRYSINSQGFVRLSVYDVLGNLVQTLVNKKQQTGKYSILWDGKNKKGEIVASGIYFYTLQVGNDTYISRRMTMIK